MTSHFAHKRGNFTRCNSHIVSCSSRQVRSRPLTFLTGLSNDVHTFKFFHLVALGTEIVAICGSFYFPDHSDNNFPFASASRSPMLAAISRVSNPNRCMLKKCAPNKDAVEVAEISKPFTFTATIVEIVLLITSPRLVSQRLVWHLVLPSRSKCHLQEASPRVSPIAHRKPPLPLN